MQQKLALQVAQALKLQQAKQFDRAKSIYLKVLKADPNQFDALRLLGILYNTTGEFLKAIDCFNRAIKVNATLPALYHNIGLAYKKLGHFDEAISYYQHALMLKPNYPEALEKLGNVYAAIEQFPMALDYLNQALRLKPDYIKGWINLGNAHFSLLNYQEAKESFQKVIQLQPDHAEAHKLLGAVYKELKETELTKKHYQEALKLEPNNPEIKLQLFFIQNEIAEWDNYKKRIATIHQLHRESIEKNFSSPISPFWGLGLGFNPKELYEVATSRTKRLGSDFKPLRSKLNFQFTNRKSNPRLRIGYFSSDIGDHPVVHLINNLFANHNRDEFETFVFSHGPDVASSYRNHIKETCEHFIDVGTISYPKAAQKIYDNNIDILIDLNGHTSGARTQVLALKPAPIQAHYLGYLGTFGADFIDYVFADEIVITPEAKDNYVEKIVYLPNTYMITDNKHPISDKPIQRQDYKLPEDAFVFCCFNSNYKIEPNIFAIWMNILRQCEKSVLWLYSGSELQKNNLRKEAQKANVNPERLIFIGRQPKDLYLASYRLADLFLDTYYYNANTTTVDALWAGLPVLTCPSSNYCGRGATSSLNAIGVPELIMPDQESYRDRAIYFYNNPDELKKIRKKMVEQRDSSLLFDTKRFVANLEQGYRQMWEIYQRGESPQNIYVKDVYRSAD